MYAIKRAAVIGAGTMGLGIAGQLANAGIEVLLLDVAADGDNRDAVAERALERLLDKNQPGLLHEDYLKRISIGNIEDDMQRLSDVDWIAEAVVEQLDIKKSLYKQIDAVRKDGCIVSSNTSTIPISLLVEDMPQAFREEFAITHFFNPVRFMRLLEIVRGEHRCDAGHRRFRALAVLGIVPKLHGDFVADGTAVVDIESVAAIDDTEPCIRDVLGLRALQRGDPE